MLEDFQLTISSFNQYLDCPRAFFYETVLNLPSLYSEAASYGSVMHRTMQFVFESMLKSKEKDFPGLEEVLAFFEKEMTRWKGYFSTTGFEQRLKSGLFHLKEIYQQWLPEWSKQVKLEFRITQTEINEVPVSGIIDRVSWEGQGAVCLVDYKTGKPKSENTQKTDCQETLRRKILETIVVLSIVGEIRTSALMENHSLEELFIWNRMNPGFI
ncbi:MAG: PD-(D/E)XK nuclease family protein [Saprospiraceae bacterium]